MKKYIYQWISRCEKAPLWMSRSYESHPRRQTLYVAFPLNLIVAAVWFLQDKWAHKANAPSWIDKEAVARIPEFKEKEKMDEFTELIARNLQERTHNLLFRGLIDPVVSPPDLKPQVFIKKKNFAAIRVKDLEEMRNPKFESKRTNEGVSITASVPQFRPIPRSEPNPGTRL